MRPRLRPRPAFATTLSCVVASLAVASVLRSRLPADDGAAPAAPTINSTLTPDQAGCAGVRSTEWHPLSGVEYTGRLRVALPARLGGALVMFVGDDLRLDIEAFFADGTPVSMRRDAVVNALAPEVPPDYWLDAGTPHGVPQRITRLQIDAAGDRVLTFTLALGRRAPRVVARLAGYPPGAAAAVCAVDAAPDAPYFATGWSAQQAARDGTPVRWMGAHGVVIVGSESGTAARVRVRAAAPDGLTGQTMLRLRVNDLYDAPPVRLREGVASYEWEVPARAWVPGANELLFSVSQTSRAGTQTRGLALASLNVH